MLTTVASTAFLKLGASIVQRRGGASAHKSSSLGAEGTGVGPGRVLSRGGGVSTASASSAGGCDEGSMAWSHMFFVGAVGSTVDEAAGAGTSFS